MCVCITTHIPFQTIGKKVKLGIKRGEESKSETDHTFAILTLYRVSERVSPVLTTSISTGANGRMFKRSRYSGDRGFTDQVYSVLP